MMTMLGTRIKSTYFSSNCSSQVFKCQFKILLLFAPQLCITNLTGTDKDIQSCGREKDVLYFNQCDYISRMPVNNRANLERPFTVTLNI